MHKINQRIAMKAVIEKDGKVLILRESRLYIDGEGTQAGRYQMPGGRIEPGEKIEDGLKREVKEETGLSVEIGDPIYVGEWFPTIKDVKNQIIAVFIVCRPVNDKILLSKDHDRYDWVYPKDRAKYDLSDPYDKVIDRYAEMVRR